MIQKRRRSKPKEILERRSVFVVVLAFVLPLLGVIGYRALERGRPTPAMSLASIGRLPSLSFASVTPPPILPVVRKFEEFTDRFRKNETITDALMRHGLTKQQVLALVETVRSVWPHTTVKADADFAGNLYPNGEFHEFRYRMDADRYITIYRDGDRFVPLVKKFDYETRTEAVNGVIQDSLFLALTDSGEQEQLAVNLADIFQWDVDFYTDIQKGDSFRILVEKKYLNGQLDHYGNILAADIKVGRKLFSAFRFETQLYDGNGRSLRKSLLKSPLKFVARITSRFSRARFHPILKIVRPHQGVDYGAPVGAPVVAVASGRVIAAGWNGGYGKSVHLRHASGLETMYSHLSRILVHAGEQVAQGEHIGDVGATGMATGPHLDFRLIQNGKYTDPTKKIVPDAPPVAASAFARFAAQRDELRSRLEGLPPADNNLARAVTPASPGGHSSK